MADLLRVSIKGVMPGGEEWSVNPVFAFSAPLALSTDELQSAVTAINAVSVPGGLDALNVPGVNLTGCRVEARKKTGELEGVAEGSRATASVGSSSTPHPFQTSIVASLRTADSSARGKGRLYWPATGIAMTTASLRIAPASVVGFGGAIVTYLQGIRTAIRGVGGMTTAGLAVWSRTNNDTRLVLSVRVGDIADVQRRRRDAIAETYSSYPVPAL